MRCIVKRTLAELVERIDQAVSIRSFRDDGWELEEHGIGFAKPVKEYFEHRGRNPSAQERRRRVRVEWCQVEYTVTGIALYRLRFTIGNTPTRSGA